MTRYTPAQQQANLSLYGSHDTARALTMLAGDREAMKLATMLLFTLPGAPCVYAGDEIGMEGLDDPGCRAGFVWDEARWDQDLLETFRALIRLRREHVATRRGRFRRLTRSGDVFAFVMEHEDETLLVATNATGEAASAALGLDGARSFGDGALVAGTLTLPARTGAVFSIAR